MSRDKYAHVRQLESEAVALEVAATRQWWRLVKNWHRRQEASRLLAQVHREIDLIEQRAREFREAVERRRASAQNGDTGG